MKLFIQIPCFNEEHQLKSTLKDLPKKIDGISEIKVLIIDDGSTDKTNEIAKACGIDYIVYHNINRGLAQAFSSGISACLKLGADIIVNTDADNQYSGHSIIDLVKPILDNKSDMVIGARPIKKIENFSFVKKQLQYLGSFVISKLSGIKIPDATSGFRAYSSHAAEHINITSKFTYTLQSIIQCSHRNIIIESVEIMVNSQTRKSRLFKNNFQYVLKSIFDIFSITLHVKPSLILGFISFISLFLGFIIGFRFIYLLILYDFNFINNTGYIQSLILASVLLVFGSTTLLVTFLANQLAGNRILLEKIILELKRKNIENQDLKIKNIIYTKE